MKSQAKISIYQHYHFEQVDSTNTWAKKNSGQWAAQGITLVTAAEQTAGRGRFNRSWLSPPDTNLYATYCFWLDSRRQDSGHIPQILALSVCEVLHCYQLLAKIKWPNDVVIANKKIAGILCETFIEQEKKGIMCGIGLNINMTQEQLHCLQRPCTSMKIENKKNYSITDILSDINTAFSKNLAKFLEEGFLPFFEVYKENFFVKKGEKIRFNNGLEKVEGRFDKVREEGSISIHLQNGIYQTFYTGEFID